MALDVELRAVTKVFGRDVVAVDHVTLEVQEGEFISLLGPSGCGKTTTLRMIAGLEEPTSGQVLLKGQDVTRLPAYRRNTGMVFQNYALFPHKSVADNVAFGLRMRGVPRPEIARRVQEVLHLVGIPNLADRYSRQLSGGQQQRVALARAIVIQPAVLLLDEPLSALDKKLREQMRGELKRLQARVGITTIFVTHDQEEALTLSDRIVIMDKGRVVQQGPPAELYRNPRNVFVADFLGTSNLLPGAVRGTGDGILTVETDRGLLIRVARGNEPRARPGDQVTVSVRPEDIVTEHDASSVSPVLGNVFRAQVRDVFFLGPMVRYHMVVDPSGDGLIVDQASVRGAEVLKPGARVMLRWDPEDAQLLAEN